jgi:signal transduction histidine kinase
LAGRSPVPVDMLIEVAGRLPTQVELAGYYVVAEALTNTTKHARASTANVSVEADHAVLRVRVSDDGCGGSDFTGDTGLVGLKDRVEALGGRIVPHSPHSAGTSLHAQLTLATDGR